LCASVNLKVYRWKCSCWQSHKWHADFREGAGWREENWPSWMRDWMWTRHSHLLIT